MSGDYPVEGRSDAQIRDIAKRLRSSFAVLTDDAVDLIACLKKTTITTEYGIKRLEFRRGADHEMVGSNGITFFDRSTVTVLLSERTWEDLKFGDGRARNTVAHELGHAVMHQGPPMHRGVVEAGRTRWLAPYRSAEHQVKIFAPAFLVDDAIALKLGDKIEIAIHFGISEESANIYLRELRRPEERRRVAQKLRDYSLAFDSQNIEAKTAMHFLREPCLNCGQLTLFPVGVKFMCKTCDRVFDRFQDGDPVEF
jgi:hypothetical protein